jgi:hypothetical protein
MKKLEILVQQQIPTWNKHQQGDDKKDEEKWKFRIKIACKLDYIEIWMWGQEKRKIGTNFFQ